MEQLTFTKDISYLSNTFDNDKQAFTMTKVTRVFKFKELNRTDKSQHKLFFLMFPLYLSTKDMNGNERMIADPEVLQNLTNVALDKLLIVESPQDEQDKKEFTNDGIAVMEFGYWFLNQKFTPFFLNSLAT
jgi:hypothetical protein